MKKTFWVLFACLLFGGIARAQSSKNFTLLGHLPFSDGLADIAGYVSGNGTEYVLVGHESGVGIVSLANPANPTLLQDLPGVNTIWREIDTYQHYGYIVNEGGDGLRIVDLSNLPGTVTYKDTVISGMTTGHTLYISGDRLYIYGADIDNGGVSIFSLADPWRPSQIGSWTTRYVHDAYVRGDTAYLSEVYDGFMEMVDLTNPTSGTTLGTVITPSEFTHNTWLNDAGNVCYTTDEVDSAYIAAFDVSDPQNMVELDRIRSSLSNGQAIPHNVKVLNDFLVTSYYKDGVQVVDGARPHNLIETGYYDTSPLSGGGFDGAWSSDPFLPSGVVLVGDMSEGLFILQPVYVRACYLEGLVTDSVTGLAIPSATITLTGVSPVEYSNALGEYATGVADSGTYTVTYSKYGYYDKVFTLNLDNGVLFIKDVELVPMPRINYTLKVLETGTNNPVPNAQVGIVAPMSGLLPYVANASGVVNDPNFLSNTYTVTGGKWGWKTNQISVSPDSLHNVDTIYLDKGYYDDFYFDFSWGVTGTATAGIWERGEPVGTFTFSGDPFNPDEDVLGDYGDQAFVTGNGGGNQGDDDVDNGETILSSPIMDLSTYQIPVIRFSRWFAKGGGSGNPNDTLSIEISNGLTSVIVKKIADFTSDVWREDSVVVTNYIVPTSNTRIRFIAADNSPGHLVEAAVDKMWVRDAGFVATEPGFAQGNQYLRIFPNPIGNQAWVEYSLGGNHPAAGRFEIRDLAGKLVYSKALTESTSRFSFPVEIPAGMYLGTLYESDRAVQTFRFVK